MVAAAQVWSAAWPQLDASAGNCHRRSGWTPCRPHRRASQRSPAPRAISERSASGPRLLSAVGVRRSFATKLVRQCCGRRRPRKTVKTIAPTANNATTTAAPMRAISLALRPVGDESLTSCSRIVTRQRSLLRRVHPRETLRLVDLELRFAAFGLLPLPPGRRHAVEQDLVLTDDLGSGPTSTIFCTRIGLVYRLRVFDDDRDIALRHHRRRRRRWRKARSGEKAATEEVAYRDIYGYAKSIEPQGREVVRTEVAHFGDNASQRGNQHDARHTRVKIDDLERLGDTD